MHTETVIYEFPVNILTPEFDSLTQISLYHLLMSFGDLKTFSADFCVRYVDCPPYFYFRSTRFTDLESVSPGSPLKSKISTKSEVDATIRCLVIALLLLTHYVTL